MFFFYIKKIYKLFKLFTSDVIKIRQDCVVKNYVYIQQYINNFEIRMVLPTFRFI